MELIQRDLKSDLGLGEHQVSGEEGWIEHAVGIAVLAYLLLIRACHQDSKQLPRSLRQNNRMGEEACRRCCGQRLVPFHLKFSRSC